MSRTTRGTTLVELLLYLGLLGFVLTSTTAISAGIIQSNQKLHTVDQVQYNTQFVSKKIRQAVRDSIGVNTGASTFDTHPGVLSLEDPDIGENPVLFEISGGRLQVSRGIGSPIFLTTEDVTVTNFVIQDVTPNGKRGSLFIELTIEQNNPSNSHEFDYAQTIEFAVDNRTD